MFYSFSQIYPYYTFFNSKLQKQILRIKDQIPSSDTNDLIYLNISYKEIRDIKTSCHIIFLKWANYNGYILSNKKYAYSSKNIHLHQHHLKIIQLLDARRCLYFERAITDFIKYLKPFSHIIIEKLIVLPYNEELHNLSTNNENVSFEYKEMIANNCFEPFSPTIILEKSNISIKIIDVNQGFYGEGFNESCAILTLEKHFIHRINDYFILRLKIKNNNLISKCMIFNEDYFYNTPIYDINGHYLFETTILDMMGIILNFVKEDDHRVRTYTENLYKKNREILLNDFKKIYCN